MPIDAIKPEPLWTIIWDSDNGKNWERLPEKQAIELLENLEAYGVDALYIFPPNSNVPVETIENEE